MHTALKRISVFCLSIVIFFTYLEVWKAIQIEMAISDLYITKHVCQYTPHKSIIIFVDKRAQKSLSEYDISIPDLIQHANKVFREHDLPMRYNAGMVQIREWDSYSRECQFFNAEFINERECFVRELGPRVGLERQTSDPDVIVFLTGVSFEDFSGKTFWNVEHGNGTIILNLGSHINIYKDNESLNRNARKYFLRCFAHLLIHEQGHLYGLDHVQDRFSIMNENASNLGDHRVRFDKDSLKKLNIAHSLLQIYKKTYCSAP